MGWTEYHAKYYKNGKVDRKAECDDLFDDANFDLLKSSMVGSTHYAAIKRKSDNVVFATITLTGIRNQQYYNFAYKDMDETSDPCERKCPKSILNLLTETDNEFAKQWRKKCWEYHNSKIDKPSLGSLHVGSIVEFTANEITYQAKKVYGCAYLTTKNNETKIKKIDTCWKLTHNAYGKVSSRCINSWGYTIIHAASKAEEQELKNTKISAINL